MIISRTPFRISLFGGGTDYPLWFREHGGAVLGTAIDKYCYVSIRFLPPFFEHRFRIAYSQVEAVKEVAEIRHPAVRGVLTALEVDEGLEIHHNSDLPARSGLGSSSSFTVGLLHALHALRGRMVTKEALAREAIHMEQEVFLEPVGSQDQLWATFGGLNRINFHQDGGFDIVPLILPRRRREELRQSILLCFTGFSRFASDFARDQLDNLPARTRQLERMREMVDEAQAILCDEAVPIAALGELLHESWRLKRELARTVSNSEIDDIYAAGRDAGAFGGKLLGAGGGGFMVFLVEPGKRNQVRERLKSLIHVNVGFDHEGSKIALYQPDGL